jgi:hypothetical protein
MTAFWDIARVISLKQMLEAVCTSETSVYFNKTTLGYIPQGCHFKNSEENILGQEKIYKMETGKTQSEEIHMCVLCTGYYWGNQIKEGMMGGTCSIVANALVRLVVRRQNIETGGI